MRESLRLAKISKLYLPSEKIVQNNISVHEKQKTLECRKYVRITVSVYLTNCRGFSALRMHGSVAVRPLALLDLLLAGGPASPDQHLGRGERIRGLQGIRGTQELRRNIPRVPASRRGTAPPTG